ncbi:helix-turn-helix domain-containing protein [Rhodospirillum sp. A1_3_36]|uniref:helix-turn-helix domain-containing protein n=1 Tax=Rhodospirillum sp. A1_3_36 TaxID=3391666 RepID=UPI0039A7180C
MGPDAPLVVLHREWIIAPGDGLGQATAWASDGGGQHLIPPDGSMDMILRWRPDGSLFDGFVSPPSLGAFSVILDPRDRYAGVRLPPPLGFTLLGPPADFAESPQSLPPWLWRLGQAVLADPDRPADLVARDLARALFLRSPPLSPEALRVDRCWALLRSGLEPGAALREAPWSERAARRSFARIAGVSPRFLSTVARMERAGWLLARGRGSLAQIAQEAGFTDQAHMGRSLRVLTGLPAGAALALLAERYKTTGWLSP